MTEAEQDEVRARVRANDEKLAQALAPLYLGKLCPVLQRECAGPSCMFFLPTGSDDQPGKITGGACSVPLIASQVGPIAGGLGGVAMGIERMFQTVAPKVQVAGGGLVKG